MLSDDDECVPPDFLQIFKRIDYTIRIFYIVQCLVMLSCTPQKYRAAITIFISLYVKFKHNFSVITHQDSINIA